MLWANVKNQKYSFIKFRQLLHVLDQDFRIYFEIFHMCKTKHFRIRSSTNQIRNLQFQNVKKLSENVIEIFVYKLYVELVLFIQKITREKSFSTPQLSLIHASKILMKFVFMFTNQLSHSFLFLSKMVSKSCVVWFRQRILWYFNG